LPWQVVFYLFFFTFSFPLFTPFILQAPVDKTPSGISPPLSTSSAPCELSNLAATRPAIFGMIASKLRADRPHQVSSFNVENSNDWFVPHLALCK
jgi:hypothetical protein